MTESSAVRYRRLIVIAVIAMIFLVLAIAEVMASHGLGRPVSGEPAWALHVRAVDQALGKRDVAAAERAWREAYAAALGSGTWEGMIEVGDASMRIGRVQGVGTVHPSRARQNYLEALFRARAHRSVDGILRSAEAFAALGDRSVVAECLRIAERAANGDATAMARVRGFAAMFESPSLTAGTIRLDPF